MTVALGGELLALGGLAADAAEGRKQDRGRLRLRPRRRDLRPDGRRPRRPGRFHGAAGEASEAGAGRPRRSPPERAGVVAAIDTRAIGIAVVELGGGRMRADDTIDHAVGFTALAGLGAEVGAGRAARPSSTPATKPPPRAPTKSLRAAYTLGDKAPPAGKVVYERIGVGRASQPPHRIVDDRMIAVACIVIQSGDVHAVTTILVFRLP